MTKSTHLRALQRINADTVTTRPCTGQNIQSVYFLELELGQIRPFGDRWGWRTKTKDYVFSTRQEAAIAFVTWVLKRYWEQHKAKVEARLSQCSTY